MPETKPPSPLARLLVVDDEMPQMRALCNTLRDQGYETTGFTDGREALKVMDQQKFDLLLSDLMMPTIDGIALLKEALAKDSRMVGIIMTGEGTIATAVEAMKAGAFDYILKPFRLSIILPVLSRALAMQHLRLENEVLAARVRERTAELEDAYKELESFSFSVSHDLRAPLRHIGGFSGLLLARYGKILPEEPKRLLDQIVSSTERMGQLIDDLLRFSRLSRQPVAREPVDVGGIVRQTVEELRRDQGDRAIETHIGELPECVGDPSLLRQVFVNLLSNAFKFTRQRNPAVVAVGCRIEGAEKIYYVRDNGAGFDMQYAGKMFGVFQRFHSSDSFEGTGVGLSIVQRIIQRHGGRVWAEAEVDKGATFYLALPGSTVA